MKLIRRMSDLPDDLRGGALSIGNFDGVHRGHAALVSRLKDFADRMDTATIVFTFDPHPVRLLRPDEAPPPLTWTNRKADLLAAIGVDAVVAYPTDRELLQLSAHEFFERIVVDAIGARAMVEGPNFYFGRGREGDIALLETLCRKHDIELAIVPPVKVDGELISSSRIRDLIRQGDVSRAARMLTQPYRIRGLVTHGAARGKQLGFPTANMDGIDTLIPAMGIYAGRAYVDGRPHWSAIHIGPSPTFGDQVPKVEVHILEFENSIYGQPIEVDFIERLRDIRQFDSTDELIEQMRQDVARTRQIARRFDTSNSNLEI